MKRIRTVKVAKKFLKVEMDTLNPSKKAYTWVKWDNKRKSFLCDTRHGQRVRIFNIEI